MAIKPSNLNNPTSAKMAKIGTALISVSSFISASAFATSHEVLGFIAIGVGVAGTFIVNMAD